MNRRNRCLRSAASQSNRSILSFRPVEGGAQLRVVPPFGFLPLRTHMRSFSQQTRGPDPMRAGAEDSSGPAGGYMLRGEPRGENQSSLHVCGRRRCTAYTSEFRRDRRRFVLCVIEEHYAGFYPCNFLP